MQKKTLVLIVILVVIGIAITYMARAPKVSLVTSLADKEGELTLGESLAISKKLGAKELKRALLSAVDDLRAAPAGRRDAQAKKIAELAELRAQQLIELIKVDPESVYQNAIPESVRQSLPEEARVWVEQRVSLDGTLDVVYVDAADSTGRSIDEEASYVEYILNTTSSDKVNLHFFGKEPALKTGDRIRANGVRISNELALSSTSEGTTVLSLSSSNSFGDRKTVVMLVNFTDNTGQPYTTSHARGVMVETSDFMFANSYGQTRITGANTAEPADVYGWFTLNMPEADRCNGYQTVGSLADQAATAASINLSQYSHKVYAWASGGCGWSGRGTVGGNPSRAWVSGSSAFWIKVLAHEMGHNLGLWHANSYPCASGTCTHVEYGDPYDMMAGGQKLGHYNAFLKDLLGWLNYQSSPTIANITSSGNYTISSLESGGTGPKALSLLKSTNPNNYYYVELRNSGGSPKVVVHTGTPTSSNTSYAWDLDQVTSTDDWILDVGQTFTTATSATITNVSMDTANATIAITTTGTSCTRSNPTISVSPTTQQGTAGQTLNYSLTVTNRDGAGCTGSNFDITPTLPSGWIQTPSSISLNINPGASGSQSFSVTSSDTATGGSYTVTERATNASATSYTASTSVTHSILAPDSTPPTVTITSPSNNATFSKGNMSIEVSASDAGGIAEIAVWVGNNLIKTCYGLTSCSAKVSAGSLTDGTHVVMAEAKDNALPTPNSASTSINICKSTCSGGGSTPPPPPPPPDDGDGTTPPPPPPPPESTFQTGDRIRTTTSLRMRSCPSTSCGFAGPTKPAGSLGTLTGTPVAADGYIWWSVDYDQNPDGWSAENWFEKI